MGETSVHVMNRRRSRRLRSTAVNIVRIPSAHSDPESTTWMADSKRGAARRHGSDPQSWRSWLPCIENDIFGRGWHSYTRSIALPRPSFQKSTSTGCATLRGIAHLWPART